MAYLGKTPSQAVRSRYYFTASGGETSLAPAQVTGLSFTDANYVDVSLNGVALVSGTDYTATPSTNTISSLSSLTASDVVEIVVYDTFSVFGGSVNGDFNISGGDLTLGDNDKAIFGAGSDLQIYHDGHSYIKDAGSGDLIIQASDDLLLESTSGENYINCNNDGSVEVFYDGGKKFETTSTGVDVTGNINVGDNHIIGDDANDNLTISSSSDEFVILEGAKGILARRGASDTNAIRVGVEGDISFYADNGTTQGLYWDADQQRLGLGPTSPAAALHIISGSDNANTLLLADTATDNTIVDGFVTSRHASSAEEPVLMIQGRSTGSANEVLIGGTHNNTTYNTATSVQFYTASSDTSTTPSERMRIDNSGRVGIGTSSPSTALHVEGANGDLLTVKAASGSEFAMRVDGNEISFKADADNDEASSVMTFDVDGSERMRLDSSGRLMIGATDINSSAFFAGTAATNEFAADIRSTSTSYASIVLLLGSNTNTSNNSFEHIRADIHGVAQRFSVRDSGNVKNTNNSYGALSDSRMKENIVDANSQWDDIKALRVRKYNRIGDEQKELGVIAQELEASGMGGLVEDGPYFDVANNPNEETRKSVKYSILYMKAVKALQEAMNRIETLETQRADLETRLTALENAE